MACCGKKTKSSYQLKKTLADFQNGPRKLSLRPEEILNLQDKFEVYSIVENGEEIMREPQFREMLGTLGTFFISKRIFRIVLHLKKRYNKIASREEIFYMQNENKRSAPIPKKKDNQTLKKPSMMQADARKSPTSTQGSDSGKKDDYITLMDYAIYMDIIYHGTDDDKS